LNVILKIKCNRTIDVFLTILKRVGGEEEEEGEGDL
jgi:hypothetical protein